MAFPKRIYVSEFPKDESAALAFRSIDDIGEDEEANPVALYELVEVGKLRVQKEITKTRKPRR